MGVSKNIGIIRNMTIGFKSWEILVRYKIFTYLSKKGFFSYHFGMNHVMIPVNENRE